MGTSLQDQSAYHEGFFDAVDGEPLFDDADRVYAAGWRAWWEVHDIVSAPGFLESIHAAKLPSNPLRYRFNN